MSILITGSEGFIGRNLVHALRHCQQPAAEPRTLTRSDGADSLDRKLEGASLVLHAAGVNRPKDERDFQRDNVGLTRSICEAAERVSSSPRIVLVSSTQAVLDNPYGRSKLAAEQVVRDWSQRTGSPATIYRLPGVFGKWSRPHYNTVVATFCHQIARGEPIHVRDPDYRLPLVYIDDVVAALLAETERDSPGVSDGAVEPVFELTLGELADRIRLIAAAQSTLMIPDLADPLNRRLFATYLTLAPRERLASPATMHSDARGWLFEMIKSPHVGQLFVSSTEPGAIRGQHHHQTKVETFCVIQGEGLIRMRRVDGDEVIEFPVSGERIERIDMPPGMTHSIENTGDTPMITLFWAGEPFDPDRPDTYRLEV